MQKNWHVKRLVVFSVALGYVGLVAAPGLVQAQAPTLQSLGVAHYVAIENPEDLRTGQIISHIENQYQLSTGEYDKNIVGVYVDTPGMAMEPINTDGQIPMITAGNVEVLVNTSGGPIAAGDPVTTSSTPGVGMRAGKSGFMLGVAQESFDGSVDDTGIITVMMDIKFAYGPDTPESEILASRLLTVLNASNLAALEDPVVAFRTLVAALLLIVAIIVAIVTFARVAQKGIEALGRNPLASQRITVGIGLNLTIGIVIILAGIAAAYFLINSR